MRPVGARWELASKGQSLMGARRVVQGCQEDISHVRADAPTASLDALCLALAAAARAGWGLAS
eukprot:8584832-Pyramimonas_sp.AAC.2